MLKSKEEFLSSFLPASVKEFDYVQINMDYTDLSISDILRNLHKTYPLNTRKRNSIISGTMVISILCKTETIEPLKGLFLIICDNSMKFEIYSSNYLVLSISEENIRSDEAITETTMKITKYLADNFNEVLYNLPDFYRKYVYDPDADMMDDEYTAMDGIFIN